MTQEPGLWRRLDETGVPLLITRLALGGMFIYMGAGKAMEPVDFMKMIQDSVGNPSDCPCVFTDFIKGLQFFVFFFRFFFWCHFRMITDF